MRHLLILLILLGFAGTAFALEPDSKISLIQQENKTQKIEILDNGLYTKNRLPTQMLALGEEVQIVFPINEAMVGDTTKAVVRYQILRTQEIPFDTKNYTEFNLDSLNPREINFSFHPLELGGFFLQQEITYRDDLDMDWGTTSSMRPFHVVEKFSKAVGEDGLCKKSGMVSLFKPNFSTNVCVSLTTAGKLIPRWYHLS